MSNVSLTPGSRPRRGVIGVLALLGAGALATGLVLAAGEATDTPSVAGAVELDTFSSCDDLAAWGAGSGAVGEGDALATTTFAAAGEAVSDDGGGADARSDVVEAAPTAEGSSSGADSTMRAEAGAEEGGSAEPAADQTNVAVEGVDELDLVDRLTEDVVLVASATRLAVVDLAAAEVVESVGVPWDAQVTYDAENEVAWVVSHPDTGGVAVERHAVDTGGLEPEGRWTTTGHLVDARRVGAELHVVATDGFSGGPGQPVPFADGPVPCDEVLRPEGPSDPTATLLATLPATGPVEPVEATEVVGSGSLVHVTTEAAYLATPQWGGDLPTTGIHRFDLDTLEPTGSGTVEGTLLDEFSMSEHEGVLRVAVTAGFGGGFRGAPMPVEPGRAEPSVGTPTVVEDGVATDVVEPVPPVEGGDILNEIVVLDTEGALDEVGRTERFGHPGETLHGIRFAGTTAYAVTFLQTDPFYVVDLSDPAAPQVVGEVELPGFSSYLHPLGDGLVVGFGPGADGRTAAKLFDVSDPTAPEVVDDLVLGDESAIASDHHAYLDLGDGRFALPATTYGAQTTNAVVVVDTAGGRLDEVARHEVEGIDVATRVLAVDDGWALLTGARIVVLDGDGATTATIDL